MSESQLMQKLLSQAEVSGFVEGTSLLEGVVASLPEVNQFTDPAQIIDAHGFGSSGAPPAYVDVLRFAAAPLMRFARPAPNPAPGPSFENGFAPTQLGIVPVWQLGPTRVPTGSEIWRFEPGDARAVARFDGPALGWRGAQAYVPPREFVGMRVEIDGLDLPAAFTADRQRIEVVAVGAEAPAGFETARPMVHRRFVEPAECAAIFELEISAVWRGVPCRLIERNDEFALVRFGPEVLTSPVAESVRSIEPGVVAARVALSELEDVQGSRRELATG